MQCNLHSTTFHYGYTACLVLRRVNLHNIFDLTQKLGHNIIKSIFLLYSFIPIVILIPPASYLSFE